MPRRLQGQEWRRAQEKRGTLETLITLKWHPILPTCAHGNPLLRGHVPQMQQILRRLIVGKLTFTPKVNGDYEFAGRGTVRPLLNGVVRKLASPTGFEPVFWP